MHFANPRAVRAPYPDELRSIMNLERARESRRWLAAWPGVNPGATPLRELPDLAARLGVARIAVKDESVRSPLGSFKALGAPVALVRELLRRHPDLDPAGFLAGRHADRVKEETVISATDGNHGRGLAAAARDIGCRCVIVLHAHVSPERESAIAAYGAEIVRIAGNYDDSVTEAARLAAVNGWQVISDTSYDGYEAIPRDVMQGYGTIALELIEQAVDRAPANPAEREAGNGFDFTHVLLQGGVGGLAAGLISVLWERYGAARPRVLVVEPREADCLMQSAIHGQAMTATGAVDSVMAGLACGETSPLAWRFLQPAVDDFLLVEDDEAARAMRRLAAGSDRDVPIVAGESGVAGLAALARLRADPALWRAAALDADARVLLINTEGATAPSVYRELVGESADAVLLRQRAWLAAKAPADEAALTGDWIRWRHDFHRFPETGFNEHRTSDRVAELLRAMGLDVHRGIGGTGVVASLTVGSSPRAIGLRADMDALAMTETAPDRPHGSANAGCMHGCGHDGHMAMLLGAAQLLTRRRDFDGTVRFIFQPAEEHGRGAAAMLADGLLDRFPMDEIYGAHNMPGMPAGHIATRAGGIMASEDNFVIRITGRGGHAARPHMAVDPLVIGAEIVLALQTIVARSVDPGQAAVVSCTEFITDGIRNALPTEVVIKGDTRSDTPEVQALLEHRMRTLCDGICQAHGATCVVEYTHEFAPTVNWPACVDIAVEAARRVVGAQQVRADVPPMMISEDFGRFLTALPGAFVFIGNGDHQSPGAVPLHNARYDFNDAILPIGARYFAELARVRLRPSH